MNPQPKTRSAPKKSATKLEKKSPAIIWAIISREFVVDSSSGTMSAINIVEDLLLPKEAFKNHGKKITNVVKLNDPLMLAFALDWMWPSTVDPNSDHSVKIDWITPGGQGYYATGGDMGQTFKKPEKANRAHIQINIRDLPIESEGIYHFSIVVDKKSSLKIPLRIWALDQGLESDKASKMQKPKKRAIKKTVVKQAKTDS